ncbi:MAG TPA: hypothetical protein VFG19_12145 [Geobacteraceae bacterium]|nr:hypothetical protein [Geobacteraceae bacterium]
MHWCRETHPHPDPPLEGAGDFDGDGRFIPIRKNVVISNEERNHGSFATSSENLSPWSG